MIPALSERVFLCLLALGFLGSLAALYILTEGPQAEPVPLSFIERNWSGRTVTVSGTIQKLTPLNGGHLKLVLEEGNATLPVVFWADQLELLALRGFQADRFQIGENLTVTGYIQLYRGAVELIPLPDGIITG